VSGTGAGRAVVCAGGLGTRTASWSRYIPKEFFPVAGRPGILHLLEEITHLGQAEVAVILTTAGSPRGRRKR
jgi:UTP-glucose-1-phosphate uridylyltransferase